MPEVSFYILPTESLQERNQFACKLIEKVYRSGVFAYVLTDSLEQSQAIDDLLWTFRAGSFIPHEIYTGKLPAIVSTLLIGSSQPPTGWDNTVINLSSSCPQGFQNIKRILEILDNGETTKIWGRQRYRQYQQANSEINTHTM